jgi:hypothetical protein
MPEHYPKSTVEAAIFCARCMTVTPWKVADGRRQYCIPCFKNKQSADAEARKAALPPPAEQIKMF